MLLIFYGTADGFDTAKPTRLRMEHDGVEEERTRAGRKLIADFCDLYERQTDHAYLGDRRKGWLVSAADARLSEAYRRQLAAEILQWQE